MREILFHGKRKDNGEWVEGYYTDLPVSSIGATIITGGDEIVCEDAASYIISIRTKQHSNYSNAFPVEVVECEQYEVIPETVGQFTGLSDKHGKRIFEGDICKAYKKVQAYKDFEFKGVVQYSTEIGAFELVLTPFDSPMLCDYPDCEVIGNIHDNELLENSHD